MEVVDLTGQDRFPARVVRRKRARGDNSGDPVIDLTIDDENPVIESSMSSHASSSLSPELDLDKSHLFPQQVEPAPRPEEKAARATETCKRIELEMQSSLEVARRLQDEQDMRRNRRRQKQKQAEQGDLHLAMELHAKYQKASTAQKLLTGPQSKEEIRQLLSRSQRQAMEHVENHAKALHTEAMPRLQQRVLKLGFSLSDLERCLRYIKDEAPVVIHLSAEILSKLCKDPFYRSQFETGTSKGTLDRGKRQAWENAMFGGVYKHVTDAEHPKYGCLNVTGDLAGVLPARSYGQLVLTLAPSVRHRTSFANDDSGRAAGKGALASNEWYGHVLEAYRDEELLALLQTDRLSGASSTSFSSYKECQIHGPLSMARDVVALSVPGRKAEAASSLLKAVEAFCRLSRCNVLWQGDLQ